MAVSDDIKAASVFKAPAKVDKGDATTRAARDIIHRETAERDAKTVRLRALRLAKEAADDKADAAAASEKAAAAPKKKAVRAKKKASAA